MPSYSITEPHPTALPNHYVHTGRGGAGNMVKASRLTETPAATQALLHQVSSRSSSSRSSSSSSASAASSASAKASTGRGGVGNIHPASEIQAFSFAAEMEAQENRDQHHDIWHVGRGGAGNWTTAAS